MGIFCGVFRGDGSLGLDGEVNPAATLRTAADETGIVPPRTYERIVHGPAVVFQAEVDRLHRLPAADMRATWLGIHDVRRHIAIKSPLPVNVVHMTRFVDDLILGTAREFGHFAPPL